MDSGYASGGSKTTSQKKNKKPKPGVDYMLEDGSWVVYDERGNMKVEVPAPVKPDPSCWRKIDYNRCNKGPDEENEEPPSPRTKTIVVPARSDSQYGRQNVNGNVSNNKSATAPKDPPSMLGLPPVDSRNDSEYSTWYRQQSRRDENQAEIRAKEQEARKQAAQAQRGAQPSELPYSPHGRNDVTQPRNERSHEDGRRRRAGQGNVQNHAGYDGSTGISSEAPDPDPANGQHHSRSQFRYEEHVPGPEHRAEEEARRAHIMQSVRYVSDREKADRERQQETCEKAQRDQWSENLQVAKIEKPLNGRTRPNPRQRRENRHEGWAYEVEDMIKDRQSRNPELESRRRDRTPTADNWDGSHVEYVGGGYDQIPEQPRRHDIDRYRQNDVNRKDLPAATPPHSRVRNDGRSSARTKANGAETRQHRRTGKNATSANEYSDLEDHAARDRNINIDSHRQRRYEQPQKIERDGSTLDYGVSNVIDTEERYDYGSDRYVDIHECTPNETNVAAHVAVLARQAVREKRIVREARERENQIRAAAAQKSGSDSTAQHGGYRGSYRDCEVLSDNGSDADRDADEREDYYERTRRIDMDARYRPSRPSASASNEEGGKDAWFYEGMTVIPDNSSRTRQR